MLRNGLLPGALVLTAACTPESTESTGTTTTGTTTEPSECMSQEACTVSPSIEPHPEPRPPPPDSANGTGGTNGLNAELFHKYLDDLRKATNLPLTAAMMVPAEGTYPVHPEIAAGLLKDGEDKAVRQAIFAHAIQCALSAKTSITDAGMNKYTGTGVLQTTGGWLQKGLDNAARDDLFTCMAILLNPAYQGVPVFMSGPAVSPVETSTPPYCFAEAIWSAVDSEVGVQYHVWPLFTGPDLPDSCAGEDPMKKAFEQRVCGTLAGDCDVDVRVGLAEAECEEVEVVIDGEPVMDGGHFRCAPDGNSKRNAIRTMLTSRCDIEFLYCPVTPM